MIHRHYRYLFIVLIIYGLLPGCATIFNGSSQDVPVRLPKGTIVFDSSSYEHIPLRRHIFRDDTSVFIELKRNRSYDLLFSYNGSEIGSRLSPVFDGSWIEFDLFFYVIPLLPDLLTGSLNTFDGVSVHFPNDSTDSLRKDIPYTEPYNPDLLFGVRTGLVLLGGIGETYSGYVYPIFLPNQFIFGIGYDFSDQFSLLATWQFAHEIDYLPKNSKYYWDYSHFSFYQIESRYKFFSGFYGSTGGGIAKLYSDNFYYSDSSYVRHEISGINKIMPIGFFALGYSGKTSYIELRYEQGFSKISFSDGEENSFHTISLNFGFNFHL